jgi:hypothetical protein
MTKTITLSTFAIASALVLLATSTIAAFIVSQPAYALTRFFNCTTIIANRTHQLTLQDVNYCYDIKFPRSGH